MIHPAAMQHRTLPQPKSHTSAARTLAGIWTLLLTGFIVATLYIARDILMPFALSVLLTFLLAPLVTLLERWLGRVGAVLLVAGLILGAAGGGGWLISRQLVDLASKLPDYTENIQTKLHSLQASAGGRFIRISEALEELKKDFAGAQAPGAALATGRLDPAVPADPGPPPPIAVQVVEVPKAIPLQLIQGIIAPLVGPLGTVALVLLLVVLMLLKREDLRSRLLRLVGQDRLIATTRAMDDAGGRVARYLRTQLALNATYGLLVVVGLYFIGVPNAPLWGVCAAVLRYIPYVGPWIGAAIPVALSLAVAPGWLTPLLTLGLFVALELLSNNVLEPWLYGSSTGVSPIALILAAVGWAWLWGPVGLVLATPMTVCLVVLGRHIPRLSLLSVALGDQEALTPAEDCYYRLLTVGDADEMDLVEDYLKSHSLTALYDSVLIPVLSAVEIDYRLQLLDDEQRLLVEQSLRDIVEDLDVASPVSGAIEPEPGRGTGEVPPHPSCRVYCVPARADRDELVGKMLVQLLRQQGVEAKAAPTRLGVGEWIGDVEKAGIDVVIISVVSPSTVLHARYLCLKLRARLREQRIMVGLWGATENVEEAARRVQDSGADQVVTTLAEAVAELLKLSPRSSAVPSPTSTVEPLGGISTVPTDVGSNSTMVASGLVEDPKPPRNP